MTSLHQIGINVDTLMVEMGSEELNIIKKKKKLN
jgi:hypothetical protein